MYCTMYIPSVQKIYGFNIPSCFILCLYLLFLRVSPLPPQFICLIILSLSLSSVYCSFSSFRSFLPVSALPRPASLPDQASTIVENTYWWCNGISCSLNISNKFLNHYRVCMAAYFCSYLMYVVQYVTSHRSWQGVERVSTVMQQATWPCFRIGVSAPWAAIIKDTVDKLFCREVDPSHNCVYLSQRVTIS